MSDLHTEGWRHSLRSLPPVRSCAQSPFPASLDVAVHPPKRAVSMTAVTVSDTVGQTAEESVTLADLDASVGNSPDVPEDEVAVRYYSDEALQAAIRLRRSGRLAG